MFSFKNNDNDNVGRFNYTTIHKDGMEYMVIFSHINGEGIEVVNLTLDKARLNYYRNENK